MSIDCIAQVPVLDSEGQQVGHRFIVHKLLSEDPSNYPDAPREAIRRILEAATGLKFPKNQIIDTSRIASIRMATTVATNALLERKGERFALLITKGFKDLLHIGTQARPNIFDLSINAPEVLYERVIEVDERVSPLNYLACGKPSRKSLAHERSLKGISGEEMAVIKHLDEQEIRTQLQALKEQGINNIAVAFLHSYTYPEHEKEVESIAKSMGFKSVTLSSQISPMVKVVSRGTSACVDAYLTPGLRKYVENFAAGFDSNFFSTTQILFMNSDGGLTSVDSFSGFRAILSGPAGGVVGYSRTAFETTPVIGFDMGGTSTDVSRYDGTFQHTFESVTANIPIQVPQLDIKTIAAGGGSRLFYRNNLFVVGPESSGANPGPICYRKGGYLSITDANLFLGRIVPELFPKVFGCNENEPLDVAATNRAFDQLLDESGLRTLSVDEFVYGFIKVANETMCRPIRELTQAKGYDTKKHVLACFGGAGAQHACSIARLLGIKKVHIHRFASILSAYGLLLADEVVEKQVPSSVSLQHDTLESIRAKAGELEIQCREGLVNRGYVSDQIVSEVYLNLRYEGTDTPIMTRWESASDVKFVFEENYRREFGFKLDGRIIIVDDIRVRCSAKIRVDGTEVTESKTASLEPIMHSDVYFEGLGRQKTPVFRLGDLFGRSRITGPALLIDQNSTILVEPNCSAAVSSTGNVIIEVGVEKAAISYDEFDPILLSIFSHRFMGIAEQMGRTLQRTSVSTNIKERLDFSCALFGPDGGLVANAPHIPVHLGSMQEAVKYQIAIRGDELREGDVLVTNHPIAGGSHLPDITVITPVFSQGNIAFFVASRGHHADIGGISPGSMPPHSKELCEEGAAIVSFKLVRDGGVFDEAGITKILADEPAKYPGSSGSRNIRDNISDLRAQVAANQRGIVLVQELIAEYGHDTVITYMNHIRRNAGDAISGYLKQVAKKLGPTLKASDFMDDGTEIKLLVQIDESTGEACFDFAGTGVQTFGNLNAPRSITQSAVIYSLRCLVNTDIPLNEGCLAPIKILIPKGSILWPDDTAAVVGGNVLTSQRVVDVVLKAFQACAASQGCMNNLTFGLPPQPNREGWGYYETISGGSGAGPTWVGRSGVHTHMTNTRITDPEIFERRYPVLLRTFSLRPESGGRGIHRGGDGVIREIEFLEKIQVSILCERRVFQPYGLAGGQPGSKGVNLLWRKSTGSSFNLGGKNTLSVEKGDVLTIQTPGGGGYGA